VPVAADPRCARLLDVSASAHEAARIPPSTLVVQLLGRPRIDVDRNPGYRLRSRKSWALLAFLLLGDRPPTRSQLASLLFAEADDPLGALRWCLAELRRALGSAVAVDGDPVRISLPAGSIVDVDVLVRGHWSAAVDLPGVGHDLLEDLVIARAEGFESWLLSERRRIAAATEAILHEAALGRLARGDLDGARDLAVRAAVMSPLDENHQALLIRLYRQAGDDEAARRQYDAWVAVAERELGVPPGASVLLAMREGRRPGGGGEGVSIRAVIEAGAAAVSAGALVAGVSSFENAVGLADRSGVDSERISTRLALAEALIHTLGGLDEAGLATLTEAERIAVAGGDREAAARVQVEAGYVDFLRARYDRAERSLNQVIAEDATSPSVRAKAMTYLGSVASDRADYPRAVAVLEGAVRASRELGEPRREAYALSMLGRVSLLRGDLAGAIKLLTAAGDVAERDHWLSFLPWPQALLGQCWLSLGDVDTAARGLEQSFARACQIGDPCWEGISARGLAMLAEARGDVDEAFAVLLDARARANRLTDPYVWLDVHILDALCEIGRRHGHPMVGSWASAMLDRSSRTGMRELIVRAMLHQAASGSRGEADAAALMADDIDNPVLSALVAATGRR
jgi:DNA-binding SARP family transcriptional activator